MPIQILPLRSWRRRAPALGLSAMLGAAALLSASCGRSKKPIVVGSGTETDQAVLGEIAAQHLEQRLHRKVNRLTGLAGEQVVYQALESAEVTVAPFYTGAIVTGILREQANPDPGITLQRARGEMARIAQLELLDPLGYENPPAMVVRASDAGKAKTLSEAAAGTFRWKIAVSYEFHQRIEDLPALSSYRLPMAAAIRGMEASQLFPALQKGDATMIAVALSDGRLISPDFTVLADDQHAFPPSQACFLARQDALMAEPELRAALLELSGKITLAEIRKLDAEVELDHRTPAAAAAEFLASAGL